MKKTRRTELVVLTAGDRTALSEKARKAGERAQGMEMSTARATAAEICEPRPEGPLALAVVYDSSAQLADKLLHAADRLAQPECHRINDRSGIFFSAEPLCVNGGKVALLFPGEGSQYPGMLSDLCMRFPEARSSFDRIDRAFENHPRGFRPSQLVYGGMDPKRLWDMDCAVEVVFSANAAVSAVLEALELRPDVVLGHSTGDYSALFAAGAIQTDDEAELTELMLGLNGLYQDLARDDTVPDTPLMAVGAADPGDVQQVLENISGIELAMDNCPHQAVLSGTAEVLAEARTMLAARGAVLEELAFRRGYHTAAFRPALKVLAPFFESLPLRPPTLAMWSCATASPVPGNVARLRTLTLEQWAMPVRFRETIENLWENGVRIFVESGPRGNLTAFIKDILRGRPHLAVACDGTHRPTMTHLHFALGQLAAHGVRLDLSRLTRPEIEPPPPRSGSRGPEKPRRRGPVLTLATGWPEMGISEQTGGRFAAGLEHPAAATVQTAPEVSATEKTSAPPEPVTKPPPGERPLQGRAAVMAAHFETGRRMLAAQERVLTTFLAGKPAHGTARHRTPPLLGSRVDRRNGRVTASVELSLSGHPYLAHHTLGGRISGADVGLTALPVMPLTIGLELAAEAAALLVADQVCVGLEDVVARRWITLDGNVGMPVEVNATLLEETDSQTAVTVEISRPAEDGKQQIHLETRVLFASSYPPAPPAAAVTSSGRAPWDRDRVYREAMFHGELFRGIERVTQIDDAGAEAVLEVLPRHGLLPESQPVFATDPILLDQPGQVVGVWTADRLDTGFVIFPTRVKRIELYSPPPAAGLHLGCRATIRLVGETGVNSDLEVDDGQGHLHVRISGWEDRRFDVPPSFLAFMLDPFTSSICRSGDPAAKHSGGSETAWAQIVESDTPAGFGARDSIWQQVLTGLILSADERREIFAKTTATGDGGQWLLTRLVAKDAARRWLTARGLTVPPADIEITGASDDTLRATGGWRQQVGTDLAVAVTRDSNGVITAAATSDPGVTGAKLRDEESPGNTLQSSTRPTAGGVKR